MIIVFELYTILGSTVPKRVSPLAIDQDMVKLHARAQWVGPGGLPSPWAGKPGLRVSKVSCKVKAETSLSVVVGSVV